MKKLLSIIALIVLVFICTSGLVEPITEVFVWLVTLKFDSPNISIFGQLVVKYGVWIVTFLLVHLIFKTLGFFNSTAMKIVYLIISIIISFAFSWLIMIFESHLLFISTIVGVLMVIVIGVIITTKLLKRKKAMNKVGKKSSEN